MNIEPTEDVSVLICTYHPDKNLVEQIESINRSAGDSSNVRFFVFDDSDSCDDLVRLINESDINNIKISAGAKQGSACSNFIFALDKVDADWLFLSDQDDIWDRCKVEEYFKIAKGLDSNTPQVIFSDASLINEGGSLLFDSFFRYQGLSVNVLNSDDILFKNCVQGATLCINSKMIKLIRESLDGEDSNLIAMHDWWIAILARYYGNWSFIDRPLIGYRQHDRNVVGAIEDGNSLVKFLKHPVLYYKNLKKLKSQYETWLKVSERLKGGSAFDCKKLNISFLSRCKLILINLIP
ncbi:glycosyltransferase [Vibrio kanaloae]|uniref:glycosyltransferase n=1 Tax=Vibrio kanaloae TaxID=170673 RepID=UPI001EFD2C89|nr:glycosyltransferase [Vibrio kanaloae]MCG9555975.1 glycosyltransferase [Vibrio kanaloae]